jgi:hypothetical protein
LQAEPETEQSSTASIDEIKSIITYGIIALSAFTILVGFLGLLTARYKTCCAIGSYSFLTLILFVVYLGVGAILLCVTIAANQ